MGAEPSFVYDASGAVVSTPAVDLSLLPGESVLAEGRAWAGWGRRTPLAYLVVTDRRLVLLTQRLFGRGRTVEIRRETFTAVSGPDEDGFVDVGYLAAGGRPAVVRLAPVRGDATELYRTLSDPS